MMKKLIISILTATAIISSSILYTGCQSTPQRIEYNAEKTTQVSVEVALSVWNTYVKSGKATLDQERKVKVILAQYRKSALLAHDLVDAYINLTAKGTDSNAITAAKVVADNAAIETAKVLNDLIKLLASFGVTVT
jgi:hypothetical protein